MARGSPGSHRSSGPQREASHSGRSLGSQPQLRTHKVETYDNINTQGNNNIRTCYNGWVKVRVRREPTEDIQVDGVRLFLSKVVYGEAVVTSGVASFCPLHREVGPVVWERDPDPGGPS